MVHKMIQRADGSLVEVVQEQQLQVQNSTEQMGQPTMGVQQPQVQQPVQQQPTQNPAFDFIDKMGSTESDDNHMADEEREFNAQMAREKKQLDDFAKI